MSLKQICFVFVLFSDDKDEPADPNIILEEPDNEASKSASYPQWRSLLKNREPARDWTALVLRYRRGLLRLSNIIDQNNQSTIIFLLLLASPTSAI